MSNIEDLFGDDDFVTTPAVARFVDLSESQTRALASDLNVGRAGAAYAWTRDDVERLVEELDDDEDDEDDDDEANEDDDPGDEDDDEDDEAEDSDEDGEDE